MRKMEHDHGKMAFGPGYDTVPKVYMGTVYTCPMHDARLQASARFAT